MDFTNGNIFESGADILVNPVNCAGVSGAGLALQFKKRFPDEQRTYETACSTGMLRPGGILIVGTIAYLPTKRHWRDSSRIDDIDASLVALGGALRRNRQIRSIAVPPLGCGLGGLRWADVRPLIKDRLRSLEPDVHVTVFEPGKR